MSPRFLGYLFLKKSLLSLRKKLATIGLNNIIESRSEYLGSDELLNSYWRLSLSILRETTIDTLPQEEAQPSVTSIKLDRDTAILSSQSKNFFLTNSEEKVVELLLKQLQKYQAGESDSPDVAYDELMRAMAYDPETFTNEEKFLIISGFF
jgi:hypothetical protein